MSSEQCVAGLWYRPGLGVRLELELELGSGTSKRLCKRLIAAVAHGCAWLRLMCLDVPGEATPQSSFLRLFFSERSVPFGGCVDGTACEAWLRVDSNASQLDGSDAGERVVSRQ